VIAAILSGRQRREIKSFSQAKQNNIILKSFCMKMLCLIFISLLCFSFRPSVGKTESSAHNGFYIFVEDFSDRTNHKYIVDTKDSVNNIFNYFFESEFELGDIDRPVSIYNGKLNFYIAKVNIYIDSKGKKNFKHLKYPDVYNRRSKLKPVTM
jgi:hypothetical protein